MNDKLNLDRRQPSEPVEGQSEALPSKKQAWTTPSLTVIDIREETALTNPSVKTDGLTGRS